MKALKYKPLIIAAVILMVSGLSAESVFAQRSGRGGGGGGSSRGSSGMSHGSSGMSRGSSSISRGSSSINRGSSSISRGSSSISRGSSSINRGSSSRIVGRSGHVYHSSGIGRSGYYGRAGYRGRPGYHGRPGYRYHRPYYGYRSFYRPYLGFSLSVLPFGYYPFYFGADQFYYSGGLFYRQYDDEYKVVIPPVGAEVPALPEDAQQVVVNGQTYYEYKGVYYSQTENADGKTVYVVAGKDGVLNTDTDTDADVPKIGSIVKQLPEGSQEVMLKGEKYYVSPDNIYYEEVVDGSTVTYRVVGL